MLKEIFHSSMIAGAAKGVGLLASLASLAITSRLLGPEGRGYVAVVTSLVALTATVASMSLGQVALNHAAEHRGRHEEWLPASFGVLLTVALAMSAVAIAILATLFGLGIAREAAGVPLQYLALGILALPLTIWTGYANYLLLASDRVRKSSFAQVAGAVATLTGIAAMVWWFGLGVSGALLATVAGLLVSTAISGHYLLEAAGRTVRLSASIASRFLRNGLKLHLTSIGAILFASLDVLMVHHFRGPSEAGLFQLATQLYLPLLLIPQALAEVLGSKLGVVGPQGLWVYQRRVLPLAMLAMGAVAAVLALFAPMVVRLLAGPAFDSSVPMLRIYLLVVVGATINTTMGVQWIGRGLFWQTSMLTFVAGLANFLFNLTFIPRYGGVGAAIATVVGVYLIPVTANLLMALRCEREFRRTSRSGSTPAAPAVSAP
jgi:O-antigen/teichoic acid export membrane protein